MLMQWGQFVDHDLSSTPVLKGDKESGIQCCSDSGKPIERRNRHHECFQIKIPKDDLDYSPWKVTCMDFVRSMPAQRPECNFGPREQVDLDRG